MFFLEVSGTPYEMGLQAGRASRLAIGSTIDLLCGRFRKWGDGVFEKAREKHMAFTEKLCPELVEEVKGIADGSGFAFEWVYLASFYASMINYDEGCSNMVFTSTTDGPLLLKTNDLPVHEGKHALVKLKRPASGYATLSMAFAGTVWTGAGINEAGLAAGGSSCSARVPVPDEYINPHSLHHYILSRAGSVKEALELMRGVSLPPWGANIALADSSGDAAVVEKAGSLQGVRRPEPGSGALWCANHSVSEELTSYRIENLERLEESRERYEAMERFSGKKPHSAKLLKEAAAWSGRPGALCRYGGDDPLKYETESAGIFYPAKKKIEVCFTHADRDPWFEFSF